MIDSEADAARVHKLIAQQASDLHYWQSKAAALAHKVEQQARAEAALRAEHDHLRHELIRLGGEAPPAPPAPAAPGPIETIILPELRRARFIVVIPCAVPFDFTLNHRPISFAKALADEGATVLFAEVWQTPDQPVHPCGQEVYPRVFSIPFYPFHETIRFTLQENLDAIVAASHARSVYLCTLPTQALVDCAPTFRAGGYHIHYDILDDWEEFYRGDRDMTHWFSAATEREMVVLSDSVSVISDKLARKFDHLRSDIAVVRNGYEPAALHAEQFAAARAPRNHPKTIGYFGHLSDAWFDWETVFHAARQLPEIDFEIIGYGLSEHQRRRLEEFPNLRFVGLVPQKELHRYAVKWWAGIIPFIASTLSAAVDPLKIYEYLHFGLPSVVTGITGIAGYPLVHFAAGPDAFVEAIRALPERPTEAALAETAAFLKTCVWTERLAALQNHFPPLDREDGRPDLEHWRAKAGSLAKRIEEQARLESDLRAGVAALEQKVEQHARIDTALHARVAELQTQLGWQRDAATALEQQLAQAREQQAQQAAEHAARHAQAESAWKTVEQQLQAELETGRRALAQREVELRKAEARSAAHARGESELRSAQQHLQEEIARLQALEQKYVSENQALATRAAASAYEAANLRRLTSDLLNSLSWKITAPLRILTKPLFAALASPVAPGAVEPPPSPAAAQTPAAPPVDLLENALAALRRARSIVVIPCAIPFGSTLNQRPISFARHLADAGTTVLYVVWQWSRDEPVPTAGQEVYPRVFSLPLYTFQDRIASIIPACTAKSSYVCTLPSTGLVDVIHPLRAAGFHIHYDIMDDWEEFHRMGEAPWFSEPVEREMVNLSDTVTAVSDQLARKFEHLRSDIVVLRNGYLPSALASEQFAPARTPLEQPKTIGYFGHLSDGWFDWDTVLHAARRLPDTRFELIGYGLSDNSRARLRDYPNVLFSGVVAQSDLHLHVAKWWAGMIPFQAGVLSAAVDPLKIYEYLHFGLPSVVTGITGIATYPLVDFAADRDQFVAAIGKLSARPTEPTLAAVAGFLKSCVWQERMAVLDRILNQPAGLPSLYAP